MLPIDPKSLAESLRQLAEFLVALGESEESEKVQALAGRLARSGLDRDLRVEIDELREAVFVGARERVWAGWSPPGFEPDRVIHELGRRCGAVFDALYPLEPESPEVDITGFAGSELVEHKTVMPRGDPAGARPVVERGIELAVRYSGAIGRGDFAAAYALTGAALRAEMTFDRFLEVHREAERRHGGPALEFLIERFAYVLTDAEARRQSRTVKEGWPRGTAQQDRRGRLLGFWIRDAAAQAGCRGAIWFGEEGGEYRVERFEFYDD